MSVGKMFLYCDIGIWLRSYFLQSRTGGLTIVCVSAYSLPSPPDQFTHATRRLSQPPGFATTDFKGYLDHALSDGGIPCAPIAQVARSSNPSTQPASARGPGGPG